MNRDGPNRAPGERSSNDNRWAPLSLGRSVLPRDAVAHIYKPSRPAMTSGRAGTKGWRLRFAPRRASFIEPLMGWTGSDDPLAQVELRFPTLQAAIRYAERQGLDYSVEGASDPARCKSGPALSAWAFASTTWEKLGLLALQDNYGRAIDTAANRNDPPRPTTWASPMEVVRDPTLPLMAKRAILINWAYTEYLIDQATNEGMPEYNRPSCLGEVGQALLALEQEAADTAPAINAAAA